MAHLYPFGQTAQENSHPELTLEFFVQKGNQGNEPVLEFQFELKAAREGLFEQIVFPPPLDSRQDELWKHTCLEVFVAAANEPTYIEMNLSPSGAWNLYVFDSYRQGMRLVTDAQSPMGSFLVQANHRVWKGKLRSNSAHGELAKVLAAREILIGASAVIEKTDGSREYWALKHAGSKPDFHLREAFCLILTR